MESNQIPPDQTEDAMTRQLGQWPVTYPDAQFPVATPPLLVHSLEV